MPTFRALRVTQAALVGATLSFAASSLLADGTLAFLLAGTGLLVVGTAAYTVHAVRVLTTAPRVAHDDATRSS